MVASAEPVARSLASGVKRVVVMPRAWAWGRVVREM